MKKRHLLFWILLFVAFSTNSMAQIQKAKASWTYHFSKKEVKKGETVDLIFTALIDNGWYLYSSDFDPELGPILTSFTIEENPTFKLVGKLKAENPKTKFEEVWGGNVKYFTDKAVFKQTIKILSEKPIIKGSSEYQTCNTTTGLCILGNEDFNFNNLTVLSGTAEEPEVTAAVVADDSLPTEQVEEQDISITDTVQAKSESSETVIANTNSSDDNSLWGFALAAFLSGLVALLTPCVFPIIPMTVSFFTHQKDGKIKALIYGISIILIYTLIGTVVSRLNGPAFANFLSTHWIPNVLFFVIFVAFGLSFLGLFEIVLPSGLVNKMDEKADKGGYMGIFFMAFTLVLVSFSCTGPIVGSLLVASAGGAVLKPIVGMAAFSAAFAIPFTLFALFPQWLKSLPKSGGWLNTVKVVLGFLELALALKFLSIADQVYHWHILDREVYLAFWIVIFSMLGFYLLGKIRTPHDSPVEKVAVPRIVLSILVFTFVVYMVPGMWGAPLKALAGYLPPQSTIDFDLNHQKATHSPCAPEDDKPKKHGQLFHLPHQINGYFDFKEALEHAKHVNKPVFIDFTGHGCVNCREMEARVWSDPAVLKRLNHDFVVVALYVDDKTVLPESEWYTSTYDQKVKKTIGAQNADLQIVKYNNNAQPHYCIVDQDGNLLIEPINYDLNVNNFASFLDRGKEAFYKK